MMQSKDWPAAGRQTLAHRGPPHLGSPVFPSPQILVADPSLPLVHQQPVSWSGDKHLALQLAQSRESTSVP